MCDEFICKHALLCVEVTKKNQLLRRSYNPVLSHAAPKYGAMKSLCNINKLVTLIEGVVEGL